MKRNLKTLNLPSYLLYKQLILGGSKLITLTKPRKVTPDGCQEKPGISQEKQDLRSLAIFKLHFWRIVEMVIHRDRKVTNKLRVYHRFVLYLLFLNRKHGTNFVVKYLKASLLAIQKVIAGTPFSSLNEIEPELPLPRLSKGGLPAWIGTRDRRAIMSGSPTVVQFYLSMYSLHRVIDAPVKAKLNTITDGFTGSVDFLDRSLGFFKTCFKDLNKGFLKIKPAKLLFLQTSSPSNSFASWQGYGRDAMVLRTIPTLWFAVNKWLSETGSNQLQWILKTSISKGIPSQREQRGLYGMPDLVWRDKEGKLYHNSNGPISSQVDGLGSRYNILGSWTKGYLLFQNLKPNSLSKKPLWEKKLFLVKDSLSNLPKVLDDYEGELLQLPNNTLAPLGRLSFKKEAAGKLRIFAMVDGWTQSILKPLHDALFDLLAKIPNDATFDQDAAFKRAISKSKISGHCYGYDLSSATDRLPIVLQGVILEGLIGRMLASLWQIILVERDYYIPVNSYGIEVKSVRYSVGQPMGALSSWAMLALCHHGILQYCSKLIGNTGWNTDYEVLGDDIVIFSPPLAKKYVEVMALFGVELNMAKSVVSHKKVPVVEFAKRTALNGRDVSPISLKMFLNQDSFSGRIAIFDWFRRRIDKHFVLSSLKTIFKANRWDDRPLKNNFVILAVFSTFIQNGTIPFEWLVRHWNQVKSFITEKKRKISFSVSIGWYFNIIKLIIFNKDLGDSRVKPFFSSTEKRNWYRVYLLTQIFKRASSAFKIKPEFLANRLLIRCSLLKWYDKGTFLILSRRFPSQNYFEKLISSDVEKLLEVFYNPKLFIYDVDELLKVLEKIEKFLTLAEILEKPKVPKQKTESLWVLALFDRLLNSGFKDNIINQRRHDILSGLNLLPKGWANYYPNVKSIDSIDGLTAQFRFFQDFYKPETDDDPQDHYISQMVLRNIEGKDWDLASAALQKLALRNFDDPWSIEWIMELG